MRQLVTQAIIVSRTDYGEADRILTVLTPDHGKLRVLAKGVRRVKSKLAGGIELFSVSEITYIQGRGDIGTLVSARLQVHYSQIVKDLERTMAGYDIIRQLNRITEDEVEEGYFNLLQAVFMALNEQAVALGIVWFWFEAQLLKEEGQMPNLQSDSNGHRLEAGQRYTFRIDHSTFAPDDHGHYSAPEIKFLRLAFSCGEARVLQQVEGVGGLLAATAPLVHALRQQMSG